ncbi:MAG: hypothetical protein WCW90_01245 [Candidatus Paceibacterota bacterium]
MDRLTLSDTPDNVHIRHHSLLGENPMTGAIPGVALTQRQMT